MAVILYRPQCDKPLLSRYRNIGYTPSRLAVFAAWFSERLQVIKQQ